MVSFNKLDFHIKINIIRFKLIWVYLIIIMEIPENIKSLLDEKSSLFETLLWQDNLPNEDLQFSKKIISELSYKNRSPSVEKEVNIISEIIKKNKHIAFFIQNIKNIPYCEKLSASMKKILCIDINPYLISYLKNHYLQNNIKNCEFNTFDIKKDILKGSFDSLIMLNGIISDFPPWHLDDIMRSFFNALTQNGKILIELVQNTLYDTVFYYYEDGKDSPWYNDRCYIKYEVINFYKENAFLEKYTVYNADKDLTGFFSHSHKVYTYNSLKNILKKHGFEIIKIMTGWADKPRNHHLIIIKKN